MARSLNESLAQWTNEPISAKRPRPRTTDIPSKGDLPLTADDFRRMALIFPETEERAHMGHPDFRVCGKIFATLWYPDQLWAMVKLTPEQQEEFVHAAPSVFFPVKGGSGRRGATSVNLKSAKKATVRRALATAWRNAAPKGRRGLKDIFDSFGRVRMKLPKGTTVKDLIEEGRRL